MAATTVKDRQTPIDIAVQESGSVEAVIALSIENNISLTDRLVTGSSLKAGKVIQSEVVKLFSAEGRAPASGDANPDAVDKQGVDYWSIGVDFIVS